MATWMTAAIDQFGYIGIALLVLLENVFPPIPSEVILTAGGVMTVSSRLTVPGVIIAATVGAVLGALCLYGIGYLVNAEKIERFVARHGKWLRLKPEDVHKTNRAFVKYG